MHVINDRCMPGCLAVLNQEHEDPRPKRDQVYVVKKGFIRLYTVSESAYVLGKS